MRKRMIGLLTTALIPGLMTLAGASYAAEINEHTIKFATAGAIGSPIALGMDKFAEIVKEKSDGQITVKRFPGGTLGGDVQTISALQGGTVEMTTMNQPPMRRTQRPRRNEGPRWRNLARTRPSTTRGCPLEGTVAITTPTAVDATAIR